MAFQNRQGTAVDPVPFFVVAGLAFAVAYSFGPIYFAALGFPLSWGVGLSTVAFLGATAGAYYRFVWTLRPSIRSEIPVSLRFRRLLLGAAVCAVAMLGLALPLIVR